MKILMHLATFCFLVSGLDVQAQDMLEADDGESEVCILGVIKSGSKKCKDALVLVYDGNELITSEVTGKDGKFYVYLGAQNNYSIQVIAPGLLSKTVLFDTHSQEELQSFTYECDFDLVPSALFQGQDTDILDFPVAMLSYDDELKDFKMDEAYTGNYRRNYHSLLHATSVELAQE
jgi:hypothetical protein